MTTRADLSVNSSELLAALAELDGVAAVTPDTAADGVRVELREDAVESDVSTAAEALLHGRFGISGASSSRVEEIGGIDGEGRLALERLVLTVGDAGARADVLVRLDDRCAPGSAAADVSADAGSAITSALLLALEELTEDAVIGSIERAGIDGDGVARVRLRLDVDGSDVSASGEAAVIRHRPQAVVRAVLAAVEPHLP
jgi:hypothetical protein